METIPGLGQEKSCVKLYVNCMSNIQACTQGGCISMNEKEYLDKHYPDHKPGRPIERGTLSVEAFIKGPHYPKGKESRTITRFPDDLHSTSPGVAGQDY